MKRKDTKKQWGRWTFDPTGAYRSLDIQPYPKTSNTLCQIRCWPIDRGGPWRIGSYKEWLGFWVHHLLTKDWVTPKVLFDFVSAAEDLYERGV
jgi:hypothetical protein